MAMAIIIAIVSNKIREMNNKLIVMLFLTLCVLAIKAKTPVFLVSSKPDNN